MTRQSWRQQERVQPANASHHDSNQVDNVRRQVRGNLQKISRIRAKIFVGPVAPSRSHVNADVAIAQTLLQREHNF